MENTSGIRPTEYRILIKPDETYKKDSEGLRRSDGGIILPDEPADREEYAQMTGDVVAMSPWAFDYLDTTDDVRQEMARDGYLPSVGSKVLYAKYSGNTIKGNDGQEYRIVPDKDIHAVLER